MRRLLVGLVLLVVAVVALDRGAAAVAERVLAERVRTQLPGSGATVSAEVAAPFLPQVVRGRYDVLLRLAGPLGQVRVDDAEVRLQDARVPLGALLRQDVGAVPVQDVRLEAEVGYAELSRLVGEGLTVSAADGGRVRLRGEVEVLGQSVGAAAVGRAVAGEGQLRLTPERFETGLGLADSALEALLGDRFTVSVDPGLPLGLRLQAVQPGPEAVRLRAASGPTTLAG